MSEYRLDITGAIGLSDFSNINDYLELVDSNDKFTITLNSVDTQNTDLLCRLLQDKRFTITSKGDYNDGKVYIYAQRNR